MKFNQTFFYTIGGRVQSGASGPPKRVRKTQPQGTPNTSRAKKPKAEMNQPPPPPPPVPAPVAPVLQVS